ncbi:putative O-glycosylation ligase, exosortase A system-associated [Ralstonia sp.]|uniref:putative O-glycosylation ligase, exosortase A system-associated n=1 Tax=Ralstonia sp. TaxID=54061 RepID=UPI00257FF148|nr:putative O-glycosylation ligase, exosortase A system-associated [Ralstonia sp.]MBA4282488.1 putative O-glycosylation ligase, exosortase A system-associated [Ralstonia sp.]
MRDIALLLMFIPMAAMALRYTWCGVLLWTWFSLMNPHRLTWGFAYDFQFAAIAAAATLLSMVWNRSNLRFPADGATVALILFMFWLCITTALAFYPGLSLPFLDRALKVLLMTLVALIALRERKHIELFVWVTALSIGFYGLRGGLGAAATGFQYRVWGPMGSFIADNNAIGLALVMTIPLIYYLWQVTNRRWIRYALLLLLITSALAVLGTKSRGGFVAILFMAALLWWRAPRKILSGMVIVALAAVMISLMSDMWVERMQTIKSYKDDTSAMQRINAWETAINVANDRVTGAGFLIATRDIFDRYSPNPEWVFTAHSIYFQALGEHGWIGLILFLAMGFFTLRSTWQIKRLAATRPECQWARELAAMIQVSMVGYAVGGAFLSLSYFDLPYNLMVMAVATKYWLREERWKEEPVGPFGATSASQRRAARRLRPAAATPGAAISPQAR